MCWIFGKRHSPHMVAEHFGMMELFWRLQIREHPAISITNENRRIRKWSLAFRSIFKNSDAILISLMHLCFEIETYQHSLQLTNCLVLHRLAVNFSNFVTNMQCCLSVNHAAMHNSGHNASSIFCHLQCNALYFID